LTHQDIPIITPNARSTMKTTPKDSPVASPVEASLFKDRKSTGKNMIRDLITDFRMSWVMITPSLKQSLFLFYSVFVVSI
jgi:hypothetical protein